MAALKLSFFFFFFVLLHLVFFLPRAVNCDDDDDILKGINEYRESQHLPALKKNSRADCLANKIARNLSDTHCYSTYDLTVASAAQHHQFATDQLLKKCRIVANSTVEGMIMPVCMDQPKPKLVVGNYTQKHRYSKYLNSSKYDGAGIGCKGDWRIVVLTAKGPGGSFVASGAAASLVGSMVCLGCSCLLSLLLGLLLA